jgi:predicted adenine nucleotide alpha hydrolase (AANH) superfamily ATPase
LIIEKPVILLHSCCAPCLTSVYEQLATKYEVVVFWYNPNIWPKSEHDKRYEELIRYAKKMNIEVIEGSYNYNEEHQYFVDQIKGLEKEPEKGKRCDECYKLRLLATAWTAHELNHHRKRFDYFASELSVSPHKKADVLNSLGKEIEKEAGIKYLENDFKKAGGFKRSVELSKEHDLYRQNYCGCEFSLRKPLDK